MSQMIVRSVPFYYGRDGTGLDSFKTPYPAKSQDKPALLEAISGWLGDMLDGGLPVAKVSTAGTYTGKTGAHGQGLALDVDAVLFGDGLKMVPRDSWQNLTELYVRTWAALLRNFSVVLSGWYNADHHDHFHVDLSGSSLFGGDKTVGQFIQAALKWAGFDPGTIDGVIGSKTQSAFLDWWKWARTQKLVTADAAPSVRSAMANSLATVTLYGRRPEGPAAAQSESDTAWTWATKAKLMDGTGRQEPVTREMLAVILRRYEAQH